MKVHYFKLILTYSQFYAAAIVDTSLYECGSEFCGLTICAFWILRGEEKSGLDLKWQFEGHRLGVVSVDLEKKEGRRKHVIGHITLYGASFGCMRVYTCQYTYMYVVEYMLSAEAWLV